MRSCWSSTLSKILFLATLPCSVFAQFSESEAALAREPDLGGYLFPINPGQPNYLAGTMGELRDSHFHGGLDIRTNNRIGVPVRATQDGYISRAISSSFGYGLCLLVTHPDGNISLYGHLDKFKGRMAAHMKKEQYRRKTFELELSLRPNEFPVRKGDTIAFSGNTGSSQGPHLHFEIRNGNYMLNPLKFGFTEIKDNIPPGAQKIALRTLDIHSRINDRFGRFEFSLVRRSATEYVFPVPILAHGRIGVELLADDRMNDSPGRCGINYIEMFLDSQQVFSQTIEKVDMDESGGIKALMDYKTLELRGKRFNKLYVDQGNRLEFYTSENEGIVNVGDSNRYIRIALRDESGNKSNVRFQLKSNPLTPEMVLPTRRQTMIESDILENYLMVTSKACQSNDQLTVYHNNSKIEMNYTYKGGDQRIYLIDLRSVRPDSVSTCVGTLHYHFKDVVPSQTKYTYYSDWVDIRFQDHSLYDTLYLAVNHKLEKNYESFIVGDRTTPLHTYIHLTLKPTTPLAPSKNLAVYRREGNGFGYVGGDWANGKVRFYSREFGEFTFLYDSLPPSITKIRLDGYNARFRIRDGLSGVAYYEANVNGQWLLMTYDYKSGILQSDRLDPKQLLKGDFELKVVDRAGNERIFKQKIL